MKTKGTNNKNIGFYEIDAMIDELSCCQFSILSWYACGKSLYEISSLLKIHFRHIENDVSRIEDIMGVDDIREAVSHYSLWIDEIERKMIDDEIFD
ncbi:MAG: hypothetical protein P1U89_18375 [Verrucomicrobiales bacterium]|nr:hypothetical protein [Verrucomicrobiales bacterium]